MWLWGGLLVLLAYVWVQEVELQLSTATALL